MFNFGWGVIFVLVNFALFLICYRLFGKQGLYAWIGAAVVLANIQVIKTIDMFGFVMTLGNTMYATIYLVTDLLNEKHGEKEAKKVVWFGFFILIMSVIIMQMVLVFEPVETEVPAQSSLETIFGLMPRIALGSLAAYFVSQFLDVKLFSKLKVKFPTRGQLWIRNIGSTGVSQMVDTLIFCGIAFAGVYTWDVWWDIVITTYVIKFVISAASTPVIYWARSFKFTD
ncbi:queuosine precursor transporter [Paenibacillus eucommiae]|uniref:Probable queuosine precursor transporter n=1 Tax=Paenibacillus eucommiae TaxID=1355755 RepID=A0ABS4IMN0_9BACL|nr:queuosine precursor transporter [Paenibacillus eucommiae]MBP1988760.1 putative integral membrane protein (TIGR00697 family) [Paenibacillus eucommiae]